MNTRIFTVFGRLTKKTRVVVGVCFLTLTGVPVDAQSIPVWKLKDLQTAVDQPASPVIINFWATFCKPCIAELPHFQKLANKYKSTGVRLIPVSLDLKEAYPSKIAALTKKLGLVASVVWLDEANADAFCPVVDSSWSGVIPATLFLNPRTGYRRFYEEELSAEAVEKEIKAMLKPKKP